MENYSIKNLNNAKKSGLSFSFMIIAYVFISFFGQPIVSAIFGNGSAYKAVCATFSSLAMTIAIILLAKVNKEKSLGFLKVKKCKLRYCLLAVGVSFGMLFGLGFINDLIASLFNQMGFNVKGVTLNLSTPLHLIVFSIAFAVLPAIFEECFFRGVIFGGLNKVSMVGATLSGALCFALYHGSVAQLVYQFIYGAILCLLFYGADSIIPCIIAHFLNNFSVLLIAYFKLGVDLYNPLVIFVGLVVLAFTVLVIYTGVNKKPKEEKSEKVTDFWLPFGALGGVVCLAILLTALFLGA